MFQSYRWHRLSFAKWMEGERYRLKGARLVAYSSGSFGGNKRQQLEEFLEVVFSYCGTISLSNEIKPVNDLNNLQAGDVFIKAGSPGHAIYAGTGVNACIKHTRSKESNG